MISKINGITVYYHYRIGKDEVFPTAPFPAVLYADNKINAAEVRSITTTLLINNCKYIFCSGDAHKLERYADEAITFLMEQGSPFWAPTVAESNLEQCLYLALFALRQDEWKDLVIIDCDNTIRDKIEQCARRFGSRHYLNTYRAMRKRRSREE